MEPTLDVGQRVLVSRFNYHFSDPDRGDIVVFHPPEGRRQQHVRRPEARGPGLPAADAAARQRQLHQADRGRPGRHALDPRRPRGRQRQASRRTTLPSLARPATCNFPRPIKIPPGHFFMMGDNRGASDDSRFWGPVPREMDHRPGLLHLLAAQSGSASSETAGRGSAAASTARAALPLRPRIRAALRRGRRRGRARQPRRAARGRRGAVRLRAPGRCARCAR